MKIIRRVGIVLCVVSGIILGNGCQKQENPAGNATGVSAEKNSFKEVTSKLDAGGNLYFYLSTEQWLDGLSKKIGGWRSLADDIPNLGEQDRATVGKVFDVVTDLVQKSGVEDISGVGMSSIEREKGVYHSKFILHHYAGKGSGLLWTMFGKKAHALNGLDLLPATTAIASFSDMDLGMLWPVLQQEIGKSGIPGAKEQLEQWPDEFAAATGLQLDKVLASLGNEYGLVITLDETRKIAIPFTTPPLQVPEPGVMLVIKVKDDTIFNRVEELLKDNQQVIRSDKDGVKMRTMPLPIPFLNFVRPSIARSGDYLFVATSDGLIEEALAVKAGKKPGLKASEEFKHLAKGAPTEGNSFSFVSERFTRNWKEAQARIMENQKGDAQQQALMQKIMELSGPPAFSFNVSANTDEGWVAVGNGNQNPAKVVLLPAVVAPAVAAGFALPALAQAKQKAQNINCINNLKQIQLAKQMWANDKNKGPDDVPTWADLKPYLPGTRLKCPSGGTYRINAVGKAPTCSHPGHVLPND